MPLSSKMRAAGPTTSSTPHSDDHKRDVYLCPGGKQLVKHCCNYAELRPIVDKDSFMPYRVTKQVRNGMPSPNQFERQQILKAHGV